MTPRTGGTVLALVSQLASAALAAGLPGAPAQAAPASAGPAFNCQMARGSVQTLLCADDRLAALDRQLDGVYRAALARSRGALRNTLRADQRGWVKGRDDCWKATPGTPTWLTESGVVHDMRSCVDGLYQLRIAELQVRWQLVPARPPVAYGCNGNPANELTIQFFESFLPAGRFERGDQSVVGYQVRTASGTHYEGRNLSFWPHSGEATVTWLGETLRCQAK